ncbi:MAG: M3 family peptidase, partial [Planctomycetes bacterium]|nr:M3 family peptidase [Planctomycetota bacterium]
AARHSVLEPLAEDRFLCSFGHIFAGGYAAGYFSYKWAEVLSADAFAAFEEAGLDNDAAVQKVGRHYRDTILSQGGSRSAMDIYKSFRGRDASTAALLRHSGFLESAQG